MAQNAKALETTAQTQEKAAAQPENDVEDQQELTVNADSMEMLMDNNVIELEGNVVIEDPTMRLSAKKMTVHLDKDNKLRDIEAKGGVTVRKLDSSESATGDSGFYDAAKDVVTLKGNCVILQGKNTLTGKEVIYDRKKGTIKLYQPSISIPIKKGSGGSPFGGLLNQDKKDDNTEKQGNKPESTKQEKEKPAGK